MPQSFAHISSCSKSACSFWWSFAVLIVLYSKQSYANSLIEDVTLSGRSFMWQRNSIGPSTGYSGVDWFHLIFLLLRLFALIWLSGSLLATCGFCLLFHIGVIYGGVCYVELCRKLLRNLILQRLTGVLCRVLVGSQFAYFAKRRTFLDFGLCEETNILGFWLVRREQHFRVLTFAKGPFCKSMLTLG